MKSPLELYKLLKKTNCRECMLPSCMAFAAAIIQGQKKLTDCPHLDQATIDGLKEDFAPRRSLEDEQQEMLGCLKQEISATDFQEAAKRLDVELKNGKLCITCFGKEFRVDAFGGLSSQCHNNLWVQLPLLNYIIHGKGKDLEGNWTSFAELRGAADWSRFFSHRCEESIRQLADAHKDLVFEILHLFGAQPTTGVTNADHSLIIHPLPKVPFQINYWQPEDGFESKLNILFDHTAPDNLNVESIYMLARGIVEMFRELIVKHSKDGELF